jgi:hypothetical protein
LMSQCLTATLAFFAACVPSTFMPPASGRED